MSKRNVDFFTKFTTTTSSWLGRPWVFVIALGILVVWAISGPVLGFSDTWQLVINTGTTIVTFLMVFIIQNTQNRDNMAINIKLDALMDKLDITEANLIEAEDESDKRLENRVKKVKNRAENANDSVSSPKRKKQSRRSK